MEPQITVGLFTDVRGFPLMVQRVRRQQGRDQDHPACNRAFAAAHQLPEVTVVADAWMLSEANLAAIEDAGLRFIVGARIPDVPYQVAEWRRTHPERADRRRTDLHPAVGDWHQGRPAAADDLLLVPSRPRPTRL